MGEMLKFTKTETTERGATKYLARDGYGVVGRDVTYAGRDGGSVTARRFMAYAGPTELLGEFARKTDAVAACQRHADASANAAIVKDVQTALTEAEAAPLAPGVTVQVNVSAVTEAEVEAIGQEARTVADFFPDPKNPKRKELVRLAKAAGAVKVDSQIFMPGRVQPIAKSWPDLIKRLAWGGSAPEDVARLSIRMARIKRNTAPRLPTPQHLAQGGVIPAAFLPKPDPATEDDTAELFDRVLRRVRYETLRAFLLVLDEWVAGGKNNHAGSDHSGELEPCWETFHASDIRTMVNDTARELGTAEPHREQ